MIMRRLNDEADDIVYVDEGKKKNRSFDTFDVLLAKTAEEKERAREKEREQTASRRVSFAKSAKSEYDDIGEVGEDIENANAKANASGSSKKKNRRTVSELRGRRAYSR